MKKRIILMIALLLITTMLSGCDNMQVSDELKGEIIKRCTPLAKQWFAENEPNCIVESIDLFNVSRGEVCFDVISGNYSRNDKSYRYYLNVDTGEFGSDEYYDVLVEALSDYLQEIIPFEYKDLGHPVPWYLVMHGKVVSDENLRKKRKEMRTYDVERECDGAYLRYNPEDLNNMVLEMINKEDFEIELEVEDAVAIIEESDNYSFLIEHDNWKLYLTDGDKEVEHWLITCEDGEYQILKGLLDEENQLNYEEYLPVQEN